ncbi:hypothetical protein HY989_03015 [Candidatus Micrarchaeota archaeon]|nr:hypothetical protein [Candidatus Micrarchaeota archaeon]
MKNQLLVYSILLFGMLSAYSDYSFSMGMKINGDGSAHVTEKTIFLFESSVERKAFEINMNLGESTILEWRKFSEKINYHMKGKISNVKITAKREFDVSFDAGAVIVDYDVDSIFSQTKVGSRRTIYSLLPDALAFDRTKTGQTSIGNNYELYFEYPIDAELIGAAPVYDSNERKIMWRGPIAGNWEFSYAREIALSLEVSQFFIETYDRAASSLPLILLPLFALLVLFVLVKFGRK